MKTGFMLFLMILISGNIWSQDRYEKDSTITPEEIKQAITEVTQDSVVSKQGFEELVKDLHKIEGLFTIYKNMEDGTVYLQINPDQFGKIYLCTMTRQSGDAYMFDASSMLWNFPFFFKKINKKVQLIQKNLDYRAEDPAMKRAIEKSISNSLIAATTVVGKPHPETGAILIKASDLFLRDMANVETITERYKLNVSFDKDNSYFGEIKSFPMNTEIDVVLYFKSSKWRDVFTLPDSRSMIHRYHYSLSEIPETNYRPRIADDRIGCFTTIYQNYDDILSEELYTRYINRWHVEKEKPKAKISKAKEPIVFWLENTIPEEFKPAVRAGVLEWNKAFEKIGIKDAIVVKEMPDDADWDPADARYNTICWIVQPGGGYAVGPSHANPYTGQLYDADVRISIDFIRFYAQEFGQVIEPGFWNDGFIPANQDRMEMNRYFEGDAFAQGLAEQMTLGWNVLSSNGTFGKTPKELKRFIDEGIKSLVVHEVGHTLGFRHNFKASTYYNSKQLQDKNFTSKHGISGSVMDYNPVNLAPIGGRQTDYFQTVLGSWDYYTVKYAYSVFPEKQEKEELKKIAVNASKPLHDYGTDEDSYGRGARGMDPTCNTFDLGKDIIKTYGERIELVKQWWKDIPENFEKEGKSYKKMRSVFGQGFGEYRSAAANISKYIGGIYAHRDHIGDFEYRPPYEMIPAAKQKQALKFLMNNMFAADAFDFDPSLLNKLVPDKNPKFTGGIWEYKRPDYPIHSTVAWIQSIIFSHVYNPLILSRINDNELKYVYDSNVFKMSELFQTITDEVWQELLMSQDINSYRRDLQQMHLAELKKIVLAENGKYPNDAVALARLNLQQINLRIAEVTTGRLTTISQAHLSMISDEIEAILTAQLQK
ncbi:MAG: hypothetical protein DRP58_00380 [Spirochaetes bacterium]|nr:MAG: hypothetical protein DRP58_00380 [Spirochaetota bacterium]